MMHHLTEIRTVIEIVSGIVLFIMGMVCSPVMLAHFTPHQPEPTPEPVPIFIIKVFTKDGNRTSIRAQTINYSREGHLELRTDDKVSAVFAEGEWRNLEVIARESTEEKKADESTPQSGI